jgi:S-adenosylmethionine:tRNA ribosyltransferase-isomerase
LLVIDRKVKTLRHYHFFDLPNLLDKNTLLVFNDTKVYPARLFGKKTSGKDVEILLVKQLEEGVWEALCRPGVKPGEEINFGEFFVVVERLQGRAIVIKPSVDPKKFLRLIEIAGTVPIPPYIHSSFSQKELKEKYQTVYAKEFGSAAAPTAGLHFTENVFENLSQKKIDMVHITLHIGLGTFSPVDKENFKEKKLHTENFEITQHEAEVINTAKKAGKRIIAVGTTALRALESAGDEKGLVHPYSGETSIFIYPGYRFTVVDGLLTNFHVPKSSLLMLVSAFSSFPNTTEQFVDFPTNLMGKAYQEAIKNKYRFYSFGDSSLIL